MNKNTVMVNDHIVSIHFDSVIDLIDSEGPSSEHRINNQVFNKLKPGGTGRRDSNRGGRWYGKGVGSHDQVYGNALLGWQDGYSMMEELSNQLKFSTGGKSINDKVVKRRRKRRKGSQGDEVDIHKVYQGQLDTAWNRTIREEFDTQHQLVTIMIDVGTRGYVHANDTFWTGAVATLVVDELQKAGKSVKVIVGSAADGVSISNWKLTTTSIVVKNYNEPLSLERLAAMSYAGFHRTFNFLARCFTPYRLSTGMGSSVTKLNTQPPIQIQDEIDAGHTRYIYLKRVYGFSSAQQSLNEAMEQIVQLSSTSQ